MNISLIKKIIFLYMLVALIYFTIHKDIINSVILIIPCILIFNIKDSKNKKDNDIDILKKAINNIPGFKKDDAKDLTSYIDAVNEYTTKLRSELRFHKKDSKKMEEELFLLKEAINKEGYDKKANSNGNKICASIIDKKNNDLKNIIISFNQISDICKRFLSKDDALKINELKQSLKKMQNDFLKTHLFLNLFSNNLKLKKKKFTIKELYDSLNDAIIEISEKRNIRIVFKDETNGKKVYNDLTLLKKGIFELIENSINSSSAGSTVIIRSSSTSDDLEIAIIDSGRGCSKKDIPLNTEDIHNDKIGLNIVLGICEIMNIEIRFIHNIEEGMTVKLNLK